MGYCYTHCMHVCSITVCNGRLSLYYLAFFSPCLALVLVRYLVAQDLVNGPIAMPVTTVRTHAHVHHTATGDVVPTFCIIKVTQDVFVAGQTVSGELSGCCKDR